MDFDDYLGAQNLTQEDDLREKLIESDFEWKPPQTEDAGNNKTDTKDADGKVASDCPGWFPFAIFLAMIFVKFRLSTLGNCDSSLLEGFVLKQ